MTFKMLLAAFTLAAGSAGATQCLFTAECYDSEECTVSGFTTELSPDNSHIVTEFGDLEIDFTDANGDAKTYLAYEESAAYLLTIDGRLEARLSVQMTDDVSVITYLGSCMEADK